MFFAQNDSTTPMTIRRKALGHMKMHKKCPFSLAFTFLQSENGHLGMQKHSANSENATAFENVFLNTLTYFSL